MKPNTRKKTLALLSVISCATMLAACGGGDDHSSASTAAPAPVAKAAKTVPTIPVETQANYSADATTTSADKYNAAVSTYNSLGELIHNN